MQNDLRLYNRNTCRVQVWISTDQDFIEQTMRMKYQICEPVMHSLYIFTGWQIIATECFSNCTWN